ncbi:MAG: exodeoxyribonuclease VII small subunit [Planctomycetota bacterium]
MPDNDKDPDDALSFEQAAEDVERIVRHLESGQSTLAESMEAFATGVKRLKQCRQLLESAEKRVQVLVGFDTDSETGRSEEQLQPFDDDSSE